MGNLLTSMYHSTTEENELLKIQFLLDENIQVHNYFVTFLVNIAFKIQRSIKHNLEKAEREKRKFNAIKREFFEYLVAHKSVFTLNSFQSSSNDFASFHETDLGRLDSFNNFLKLEDFLKHHDIFIDMIGHGRITDACFKISDSVIDRIKNVQNVSKLTKKDVLQFLENNFLVDRDTFKTEFTNYKDLSDSILKRSHDYCRGVVSVERIDEMSFEYQEEIEDFEEEKSCCVCLEDYEVGQQVTKLPCNHFLCRKCAEEIFKVPLNGTRARFQCPTCRDDCT